MPLGERPTIEAVADDSAIFAGTRAAARLNEWYGGK